MALFGGNVFSSAVGQRIEQATDASLASENWALNMEICDMINENEDSARDGIKAIRKRLQQNVGKNYTVVMYALIVLETCVKNCGRRFHLLATNKEFVQELVKLIGPKNDPPTAVQEKVLSLIQSWADAFKGNPEMNGVVQVYQDLKQKGVEFPMTDLDALAPIHTPQRSVPKSEMVVHRPPPTSARTMSGGDANQVPIAFPVNITHEQMGKLRSEMDIVQGNMNVFSEMLTELTPGEEHASDAQLLKELYKTLKNMQKRVVELVDKVAAEEVTIELLRVNDELNNLFLRYSRYEKNRVGPQDSSQSPQIQDNGAKPLIDLDDPAGESAIHHAVDLPTQMSGLGISSGIVSSTRNQGGTAGNAEDEFDMFAQSRKATYETSKQSGSTYVDNTNIDHVPVSLGAAAQLRSNPGSRDEEDMLDEKLQREADFDEMEAWLHDKPMNGTSQTHPQQPQQQQQQHHQPTCTSSEFDRFLAERAVAVEHHSSAANGSMGVSNAGRTAPRRQLQKDETENPLFAL